MSFFLLLFVSATQNIVVYLLYTTTFVTLEEVKNYKSLQSFKYFASGWVLEVEWNEYSIVLILGKVRHSYAASKAPLRPWVLVRSNGAVLVAHCTCMAGLAETYSRVGAILHGVETALRVRNDTPCTSKENKWLLPPPMQQIPYLQLCDIDFTAPKCHCAPTASPSVNSSMTAKIASPSQTEIQDFFSSIAKEQHKKTQ